MRELHDGIHRCLVVLVLVVRSADYRQCYRHRQPESTRDNHSAMLHTDLRLFCADRPDTLTHDLIEMRVSPAIGAAESYRGQPSCRTKGRGRKIYFRASARGNVARLGSRAVSWNRPNRNSSADAICLA